MSNFIGYVALKKLQSDIQHYQKIGIKHFVLKILLHLCKKHFKFITETSRVHLETTNVEKRQHETIQKQSNK